MFPTDTDRGSEPGDDYDCEICGLHSKLVLDKGCLWCHSCGIKVQDYDDVDYDRVQLDEAGSMTGRGGPSRQGKRPSGSTIHTGFGKASTGKSWNYYAKMQSRITASEGPSGPKIDALKLIGSFSKTPNHKRLAEELLDIGWPDKGAYSKNSIAEQVPMWRPAHPYGVGSSAATCLHLASGILGIDSKFTDWLDLTLVEVASGNRNSYGFRSLRHMRKILANHHVQYSEACDEEQAILSKANLGSTRFNCISHKIQEDFEILKLQDHNMINHPRHVLAALCHLWAKEYGLKPTKEEIMTIFGVKSSYMSWLPMVKGIE